QDKPFAAKAVNGAAVATDIAPAGFRFFDNRQKYLLFVSTCSEKTEIANRVSLELGNLQPAPPALRLFDAGVGDGTVLSRVMRSLHARFPTMPLYVGAKEISFEDVRFLLDPIMPRPGRVMADYDLVLASQPYRARASVEFKASKVVTPLARALRPGGRLIGIHSHGHDPGIEIIDQVWPGDDPFKTDRYAIRRQFKHELGAAARHYNFNASSDARSIFRYHMHTLPDEVSGPIGTSTLFAAWNAAIYVAQIEDVRLSEVVRDGRYLEATDRVLKKHGGLWFNDETYVISRRRAPA